MRRRNSMARCRGHSEEMCAGRRAKKQKSKGRKRAKAASRSSRSEVSESEPTISRVMVHEFSDPRKGGRVEFVSEGELLAVVFKAPQHLVLSRLVADWQREQQRAFCLGQSEFVHGLPVPEAHKMLRENLGEGRKVMKISVIDYNWRDGFARRNPLFRWAEGDWQKVKSPKERSKYLRSLFIRKAGGLDTARLSFGDPQQTWISSTQEESFHSHASSVLQAMLEHQLRGIEQARRYEYVERSYEVTHQGNLLGTPNGPRELCDLVLGLKSHKLFVLRADGGMGKSTTLIRLAQQILESRDSASALAVPGTVPVYVDAFSLKGNWEDALVSALWESQPPGFAEAVTLMPGLTKRDIGRFVQHITGTSNVRTSRRDLVLLIDGVNEARHKGFFTELRHNCAGCVRILATKTPPLDPGPEEYVEIRVLPLSPGQTAAFCASVNEPVPDEEHTRWMPPLVQNPLLLKLYLEVDRDARSTIRSSYALFRAVIERIRDNEDSKYEERRANGLDVPDMPVYNLYSALPAVAYETLSRGRTRVIDRDTLTSVLRSKHAVEALDGYTMPQFLDALKRYRPFIATIGDAGHLEFCHEQFSYSLAAKHILESWNPRKAGEVCTWLQAPRCDEVASYLGGGITDRSILDALCEAFSSNRRTQGDLIDEVNKAILHDLQTWSNLLSQARGPGSTEAVTGLLDHVRPLVFEQDVRPLVFGHNLTETRKALSIFAALPPSDPRDMLLYDIIHSEDLDEIRKMDFLAKSVVPTDSALFATLAREMLEAPPCGSLWWVLIRGLRHRILELPALRSEVLSTVVSAITPANVERYTFLVAGVLYALDSWDAPEVLDAIHQVLCQRKPRCTGAQLLLKISPFARAKKRNAWPRRIRTAALDLVGEPVISSTHRITHDGPDDLMLSEALDRVVEPLTSPTQYITDGSPGMIMLSPEDIPGAMVVIERSMHSDRHSVRVVAYKWMATCLEYMAQETKDYLGKHPAMEEAIIAACSSRDSFYALRCVQLLGWVNRDVARAAVLAALPHGAGIDIALEAIQASGAPDIREALAKTIRSHVKDGYRLPRMTDIAEALNCAENLAELALGGMCSPIDNAKRKNYVAKYYVAKNYVALLEELRPLLYKKQTGQLQMPADSLGLGIN